VHSILILSIILKTMLLLTTVYAAQTSHISARETVPEANHFFPGVAQMSFHWCHGFLCCEQWSLTTHNGTHWNSHGQLSSTNDNVKGRLHWWSAIGMCFSRVKTDFGHFENGYVVTAPWFERHWSALDMSATYDSYWSILQQGSAVGDPDFL